MAGDTEIEVTVKINPFEELDAKKLKMMEAKEKTLVKKTKELSYKAKFTVTSTVKWNKKKLEDELRGRLRFNQALFAARLWQGFQPYEKAKNFQAEIKTKKAFLDVVKKQYAKLDSNNKQHVAECIEEIASGASDDGGVLKSTRKSLSDDLPYKIATASGDLFEEFNKAFDELKSLKAAENKAGEGAKEKAKQDLEKALEKSISALNKQNDDSTGRMTKFLSTLSGVPDAMKKSIKKDTSDALKEEYTKSGAELSKALKPVEKHIGAAKKNALAAIAKFKKKDFSKGTLDLAQAALYKISSSTGDLSTVVKKIDDKLKKLEQTAKKRS